MINKMRFSFAILGIAILMTSCNMYNLQKYNCKLNRNNEVVVTYNENDRSISSIIINDKKTMNKRILSFYGSSNAIVISGLEIDGKREGNYFTYYSNGVLMNKVTYKNGKFEGLYESYSPQGKLIYKALFSNNIEVEVFYKDPSFFDLELELE